MAASNRSALLIQSYKVLKKHFKPVAPPERTVLENLLFSCCLECSPPEAAESAYKTLIEKYFDLNEIRVSTHRELSETMKDLSDPTEAALRLRGVLQSVFESIYEFDLENMKKQNIGQAVKPLAGYKRATPFIVSYVTQTALGGHAIPINAGAMESFLVVGIVTEKEAAKGTAPGLERAIPKNQGVEYGSLLHQLGVLFMANPYAAPLKQILLEINPGCKENLPKRKSKKAAKPEKGAEETKKSAAKSKGKKTAKATDAKKKHEKKKASAEKTVQKKATPKKKKVSKTAPKKKTQTKKKSTSTKRLSQRKPR